MLESVLRVLGKVVFVAVILFLIWLAVSIIDSYIATSVLMHSTFHNWNMFKILFG